MAEQLSFQVEAMVRKVTNCCCIAMQRCVMGNLGLLLTRDFEVRSCCWYVRFLDFFVNFSDGCWTHMSRQGSSGRW